MKLRRLILGSGVTLTLAGFAWELAYDINDPTIPLARELLFTAGAIFGMTAYFALLAGDER